MSIRRQRFPPFLDNLESGTYIYYVAICFSYLIRVLSQPIIATSGASSEILMFWLLLIGFLSRGCYNIFVLNNIVYRIFYTIIITFISFVLWEIFILVDTIRISRKSSNCTLLYFFQFFIILVIQYNQTFFGDIWNRIGT